MSKKDKKADKKKEKPKKIIRKTPKKDKKQKRWIPISAPQEFGNISLGETYVVDPQDAKGKLIRLNMMSVTGESRKQNTSLKFVVSEVKGSQAETKLLGFEIPPAHVKRMARKSKSKIDDSFVCKTKDDVDIRIKPVIVLRGQSPRSVRTAIREASREGVMKRAATVDSTKFFQQMLRIEIQRQMKAELKKIFPINMYNIRMAKIE